MWVRQRLSEAFPIERCGEIESATASPLHLINSFTALLDVLQLNYFCYLEKGYTEIRESGMRLELQHLLQPTYYFSLFEVGKLVGTFATVLDGPFGLPSDAAFHHTLEQLRRDGEHLAEATRMSSIGSLLHRQRVAMLLVGQIFISSKNLGASSLIMTVNPAHREFWCRKFGLNEVGYANKCNHVQGAEGHLLMRKTVDPSTFSSLGRHVKELCPLARNTPSTFEALKTHQVGLLVVSNLAQLRGEQSSLRKEVVKRYPFLRSLLNASKEFSRRKGAADCGSVNCTEFFSDLRLLAEKRALWRGMHIPLVINWSSSLDHCQISLRLAVEFSYLFLAVFDSAVSQLTKRFHFAESSAHSSSRILVSEFHNLNVSTGLMGRRVFCHVSYQTQTMPKSDSHKSSGSSFLEGEEDIILSVVHSLLKAGAYVQLGGGGRHEITFACPLSEQVDATRRPRAVSSKTKIQGASYAA